MITIGVDAHKSMHVALAVDEAGREVGDWQGPNSESGWQHLAAWASGLGEPRQWGIEGAWSNGRGLAAVTEVWIVLRLLPGGDHRLSEPRDIDRLCDTLELLLRRVQRAD